MGEVRSHHDLIAWQRGMDLVKAIYAFTKLMPDSERFGLISQLRRASVSVPSNIAEGYGRGTTKDYIRFLRAARGSLYEIDTQLILSVKLGFAPADAAQPATDLVNECSRILVALIRSLEEHSTSKRERV